MNTYDEMIEVIQALKDGKQIQRSALEGSDWSNLPDWIHPFNFGLFKYRVKPTPKKLVGYVPVCKLTTVDHLFLGSPQETEAAAWRYAESTGKSIVIDIFEIVYVETL